MSVDRKLYRKYEVNGNPGAWGKKTNPKAS